MAFIYLWLSGNNGHVPSLWVNSQPYFYPVTIFIDHSIN